MLLKRRNKPSLPAAFLLLSVIPYALFAAESSPTSSPIKTVVVLVMENRSFDHMLGWMKQKVNPAIDGVDGSESNPVSTTDPNSPRLFFGNRSHFVDPDPGHSFQAIREQIFGSNETSADPPPMNGFVQQAASMDPKMSRSVMNGFDPDMVGVYKALVSEFAVFDRWFASVPASTQPNRLYVHSATSHGATSNVASLLAKGYPQRTIFENLDDAGVDFGIYYQNIPATLFYRNLRKLKYLGKFHPYGLSFKTDAKNGKLPGYVVVEQRYIESKVEAANDDHPSHDVYEGQMLVKEVYETLRASPQWNQTLLLITYDEHGGFFDHVPTPVRGVPSPDGIVGPDPFYFKFDRLGVRVPTIAISPWIQKATVVHGPNGSPFPNSEYEHSSIPATVKKIFNLPSPFLTRRDAWAGTFESILQKRKEPRTDCPGQRSQAKFLRPTGQRSQASFSVTLDGEAMIGFSSNWTKKPCQRSYVLLFCPTGRRGENVKADEEALACDKAQLPTPKKIRQGGPNLDAKISEFQQELVQLSAVLNGDYLLTSYPENIGKGMTVRQGKIYIESAVKRFFEAGLAARRMGVDGDQIVQMRPSLTTRSSKPSSSQHHP